MFKLRILIVTDTYYPHVNGPSYFSQRLASSLKKRKHSVLVVAPSRTIRQEFYEHNQIPIFGIPSVYIPSIYILRYKGFRFSPPFFMKNRIEKLIKEFKPDLVHVQGHFFICSNTIKIAKKLGILVVGTNHFMPDTLVHYLHLPKAVEKLLKSLMWKNFCSVFEKVDIVTTPTKTAAQLLRSIGLKKTIIPISNGIDLSKFHAKGDINDFKKKYSIADKPTLLYVGRLSKEKNVDLTLNALSLVKRNVDFQFVIAGLGVQEQYLKNLAKKLDLDANVKFMGFLPEEDLRSLYRASHCFIMAGTAELQSIVTMEAMASGLPVIAANAVALPELVHHGKNGFLFEPGDAESIAKYIVEILSNKKLQRKMSLEGLKIIKKHDIKNTIYQYESLYKSLL